MSGRSRPAGGAAARLHAEHGRLRRQRLHLQLDPLVAGLEEASRRSAGGPATSAWSTTSSRRRPISCSRSTRRTSIASPATSWTSITRSSSTSRRKQQFAGDMALFPNPYANSRLEWRERQPRVHLRVQPARPSGLSRHRDRRDDRAARGAHRGDAEDLRRLLRASDYRAGRRRRQGDHLDVGARRLEPPVPLRRRDRPGEEPDHEGAVGRARRRLASTRRTARSGSARAACMPGKDPYFIHFYRINFDGTGLTRVDRRRRHAHGRRSRRTAQYYVDTLVARRSAAAVTCSSATSDQQVVMELEKADMHRAHARPAGRRRKCSSPKGRDGKTDIWGIIIRPTNFDPSRKYPVIENIYAGPQGSFVPKTFSTQAGMQVARRARLHRRADRRHGHVEPVEGVPRRRLEEPRRRRLPRSHPLAQGGRREVPVLRHHARRHLRHVGRRAERRRAALLFHPEFYKVAVSNSGCHDNRMDKIWWNEQWMGWPLGPHYAASSNVDNAHKLQGQADAARRRDGHQRRSGVDDAGRRTR